MTTVYYKNRPNTTSEEERLKYLKYIEHYKQNSSYVNIETGEICYNYPEISADRRKAKRAEKESNSNSYSQRLFKELEGNCYFYTVNLGDIFCSWGTYDAIFDPRKRDKIKNHMDRVIKGPYMATLELSSYSGAHAHIISGKQDYKHLKAETEVYDFFGLVEYLSKSPINIRDKYDNPHEYDIMVGSYLYWRSLFKGKALPRRSWTRLKG